MSWTEERVEKLKALWAEGISASQIAKELGGVTRNAVIGKVHRLGLASRTQGAAPAKTATAPKAPEPAPQPTAPPKPVAAAAPKPAPAPQAKAPEPRRVEKRPAPQPVPTPPAPVAEETPDIDLAAIEKKARKLSLLELTERTCKWPIGDPSRGEFHFCGLNAAPGKPYCAAHAAAAYQPMSSRRDRARNNAQNNRAQSA